MRSASGETLTAQRANPKAAAIARTSSTQSAMIRPGCEDDAP
jgi:hypothetical protein